MSTLIGCGLNSLEEQEEFYVFPPPSLPNVNAIHLKCKIQIKEVSSEKYTNIS